MTTIVVGGHSRNVGKTSVVAAILSSWAHLQWTALKVSPHRHAGNACAPEPQPPDFCSIEEEFDRGSGKDTGRYLAAGAARSFWVRIEEGRLQEAIPRLTPVLHSSPNAIIESTSIVQYIRPDLFLMVLRCGADDSKVSARTHLARADAVVAVHRGTAVPRWRDLPGGVPEGTPVFPVQDPQTMPPGLEEFLRRHLGGV